ncbi:MAG: hypothetical protein Kow00121_65380 [Elainellaceae cyanobacterium]
MKSKQAISIVTAVITVIAIRIAARAAIEINRSIEPASTAEVTLEDFNRILPSRDGTAQITLPPGWKTEEGLNDTAIIQASKRSADMFLIAIKYSKADIAGLDKQQLAEISIDGFAQTLTNPEISKPVAITTVNGDSAIQYEIKGTFSGVNIAYLFTLIEAQSSYYEVLAWTASSQFESNKPELQQIVQSLQEAQATATH